jgi:carbamoyltransferase
MGVGRVHLPPCPADDGNAIGVALLGWMKDTGTREVPRGPDRSPFLGARPGGRIEKLRPFWTGFEVSDLAGRSAEAVARIIGQGEVIGTFRGRAEFGPHALGNRSILADPRRPDMKDRINASINGREAYRLFAPGLQLADVPDCFERAQASAHMSMTLPGRPQRRDVVPAVDRADGTGHSCRR